MRRFSRILVTAALLSALVFIGVVWAGGTRARFIWLVWKPWPRVLMFGVEGGVVATFGNSYLDDPLFFREFQFKTMDRRFPWMWKPSYGDAGPGIVAVRVPYWMFYTPLVPLGMVMGWRAWRRKRRNREGQCQACGYELAGLAAGARCPECGKEESKNAAKV